MDTQSEFRAHMTSRHPVTNPSQLNVLVSAAATLKFDINSCVCPLCQQKIFATTKQFKSHVCHHMEEIALGTLPQELYGSDSESELPLSDDEPEEAIVRTEQRNTEDRITDEIPTGVEKKQYLPLLPSEIHTVNEGKERTHTFVQERHVKRHSPSSTQEWENVRPFFKQYYLDERLPLEEVAKKLEEEFGFRAT